MSPKSLASVGSKKPDAFPFLLLGYISHREGEAVVVVVKRPSWISPETAPHMFILGVGQCTELSMQPEKEVSLNVKAAGVVR